MTLTGREAISDSENHFFYLDVYLLNIPIFIHVR